MSDMQVSSLEVTRTAPAWTFAAAMLAGGSAACATVLVLATREVMRAGGFPAGIGDPVRSSPDWTVAVVASMLAGAAFVMIHMIAARRAGGFDVLRGVWIGLFGALGFNFLQFGLESPYYGGRVWTWVVCGAVFWALAILATAGMIGNLLPHPPRLLHRMTTKELPAGRAQRAPVSYSLAHLVAVPAGIAIGLTLFRAYAG